MTDVFFVDRTGNHHYGVLHQNTQLTWAVIQEDDGTVWTVHPSCVIEV